MDPIRLLLADDQNIILDGLQALIQQDPGRANNGKEAVEQALKLRPDVVLMDINMPEMDGIEATKALKALKKTADIKVLVLSMYNNKDFVNELLNAGASGYVLKNTNREELREALLTVAGGHRYLAKPVQETLDEEERFRQRNGSDAPHSLTKREKEIICHIVADKTSQQIAEELFLSPATVETHRKNIFSKLDIRSTAGLVKYAMERGWGAEA